MSAIVRQRTAITGRCGLRSLRDHYEIVSGYISAMLLRRLGRPAYLQGTHSDDVYCASFGTEDAARTAMAWVEPDLIDVVVKRQGGLWTLSGLMGRPA